jgi:Ca2+-binding RTX toxin-like protein
MRLLVTAALVALTTALAPAAAFAAPANDDFAAAEVITGATGTATGSNLDATKEAGEPDHAGNSGGHSIWYSWTAAEDGNLAITTSGSTFDTLLAVYTGGAVNSLTLVAANDDDGSGFTTSSTVSFAVSNGVTYMVAVDGFAGKVGFLRLRWHPAPANDNFADREALPSTSIGSATGDVQGATTEVGEPSGLGAGTIWYSWTAPADGTYKFDTVGSNFDSVLAIYEGSDLSTLDRIGINDDDPDRGCCSSWLPIRNTTAGTTYSIAVSSISGPPEDLVLRWSPLILGTSAGETLVGTSGDEEIRGRGGEDILRGLGGSDAIFGGNGDDRGVGGDGDDLVFDQSGMDELLGRAGDDRLNARDFTRDLLAGGAGADTCRGDRRDVRRSCP